MNNFEYEYNVVLFPIVRVQSLKLPEILLALLVILNEMGQNKNVTCTTDTEVPDLEIYYYLEL